MGQEPCMLLSTMWTHKGLTFGLLKLVCLRKTETECVFVIWHLGTLMFGYVLESG